MFAHFMKSNKQHNWTGIFRTVLCVMVDCVWTSSNLIHQCYMKIFFNFFSFLIISLCHFYHHCHFHITAAVSFGFFVSILISLLLILFRFREKFVQNFATSSWKTFLSFKMPIHEHNNSFHLNFISKLQT